jgi:hypothetical protein
LVGLAQQFQQYDHALFAVLFGEYGFHAGKWSIDQLDAVTRVKRGVVLLVQTGVRVLTLQ